MDTIDEFNMMCYSSMCASISKVINIIKRNPDGVIPKSEMQLLDEISNVNFILFRLYTWIKHLNEPTNYWYYYHNIAKWIQKSDNAYLMDVVMHDVASILNDVKLSRTTWKTPRVNEFYEIYTKGTNSSRRALIKSTFAYCNYILEDITKPTKEFTHDLETHLIYECMKNTPTIPTASMFGTIVLLMTKKNFDDFKIMTTTKTVILNTDKRKRKAEKEIFLIHIIEDASQDIFNGILYLLNQIDIYMQEPVDDENSSNQYNISYKIMRMIMITFYDVIDLAEELYAIKDFKSVIRKLNRIVKSHFGSQILYDFNTFIELFKYRWQIKIEGGEKDEESTEFNEGRLFKNNTITPSLIGYHAAYDVNAYVNYEEIMDDKELFILNLNAWTKVLLQQLRELRRVFTDNGLEYTMTINPIFLNAKIFMNDYQKYF